MRSKYCIYFAYGSNLHPLRLQARVPSARLLGKSALPGHEVIFGKRGMDGSGKCSVAHVPGEKQSAHGVLYRMLKSERGALDAAEGPDYERKHASFIHGRREITAFYYAAKTLLPHNFLPPFDWYRALVISGALFHALPDDYVGRFATTECVPDPDEGRSRAMAELLARLSVS